MGGNRVLLGALLCIALAAGCSRGADAGGDASFDGSFTDSATGDGGAVDSGRPDTGDAGTRSTEVCEDGLDNDGDGLIDEDCFCVPGETQGCFSGGAENRAVGACGDGVQTCEDALEFGTWSACVGDTAPLEEVCDGATDENCDGAIDEGCDCDPAMGPVPCGLTTGACMAGTQECIDGMLGECVGAVGPTAETCNGVDDNCDGTVDEALTRACGSSVGECRLGTEACVAGTWEACSGDRSAGTEDCNGLDDDCDGMTDESLSRGCGSAVGACSVGTQACSGGAWATCGGGTLPGLETCNNIDDDCDGTIDEGVTRGCGSSTGECRPGTETCSAGGWGSCTGGRGPATETCDGVRDENCDGTVDEGCGCTIGATRSCGSDVGLCMAGGQTCDSSGTWAPCTGSTGPVPEICNGLDDNCDGAVDEGGICPTTPPVVSCGGSITAEVLSTITVSGTGSDPDGGSVTYLWTVTSRPVGSTATPATPTRASTSFFLDASGTFDLQLCVTDDEGESACCTVTIESTPPGVLQVELSWDQPYGDVDLHLLNVTRTPPDGWWTADDCHYANPTPAWGAAGADANPTLDRDDRDGYGPENISIDQAPTDGTYNIGLHYFCDNTGGTGGATNGTIRVFCMGSLIATYTNIRLDETDDWVDVARVTWPGCVGRSVNTRTNGSSLLPSGVRERHCEISCSSNADCPGTEECRTVVGGGGRRQACILAP